MKRVSLFIIVSIVACISIIMWYKAKKISMPSSESMDTITVGINTEFPPFCFKEKDVVTGFDIDVIEEIMRRLKKEIIYKDMPFDALIPELQLGRIQVVAAGITPTVEREKQVLFTYPHLKGNALVIISLKSHKALTVLGDLRDKTVVVNEGYFADAFMSDYSGLTLLRLSSALVSDGILALQSGRADAFVTAFYSINPYFAKQGQDDFYMTEIPNTQETSAFAISKYYPDLRRDIQVILNEIEQDGTLQTIKTKWNLL